MITSAVSAADVSYSDNYLPKDMVSDTGYTAGDINTIQSAIQDIQNTTNPDDLTLSKYPKVTITGNNQGLFHGLLGVLGLGGNDIMDVKLIDNTESCTINCYSVLKVHLYQNSKLVDDIHTNVYDESGILTDNTINATVYIMKNISYDIPVPVYQTECINNTNGGGGPLNLTPRTFVTCYDMQLRIDHITGYKEEFVPYDNSELSPGDYIVKVAGKKTSFGQIVDWVPTIQGQQVDALAWWNITNPYGNGSLGNVVISTIAGERNFGNMVLNVDYSFSAITNTLYLYTDRVYNFNSFYLKSGTTLSTTNLTGAAMYIMAADNMTLDGVVNFTGVLHAGQANSTSFSYLGDAFTTPAVGDGGQAYGANASGYQAYGFGGGGRAGIEVSLCSYTNGIGSNASLTFGSGGGGGASSITKTQHNQCAPSGGHNGGNGAGGGGGGGGSQIANGNDACTYSVTGGAGGNSYGANGGTGSAPSWVPGQQNSNCNIGDYGNFDLSAHVNGGGGAGGSAGKPGLNLVLRSKTLTIDNNIYLSGTNGQKGGNGAPYIDVTSNGGHCGSYIHCMAQTTGNSGYGAGGGGGASSGNLILYYRFLSNSTSLNNLVAINAGLGGIGGTFQDLSTGQAQSGTDGSPGVLSQYQEGYAQTNLLLPANGDVVVLTPTVNFTATISPVVSVTLLNSTFYLWKNATILNNTQVTTLSGTNPTNISWGLPSTNFPDGIYSWGVTTCWTDGTVPKCEATTNNTFTTFTVHFNNATTYNNPVYEMENQTFQINATSTGFVPLTAQFMWDGITPYNTTNIGNTQNASFVANIQIPLGAGNHTFHWHVYYGGQLKESTPENITVLLSTYQVCHSTDNSSNLTVPYLTINYRDEITNAVINASIYNSIWYYNMTAGPTGITGSQGKQYLYSSPLFNGTDVTSLSHSFCFSPSYASIIIPTATYQYGNTPAGYSIKTWPFRSLPLTNTTTGLTLYLISLSDSGTTPITFQIVNTNSNTVLPNARVTVLKDVSGTPTVVDDGYTDSGGTIAFYMSPITPYTLQVSATGCTPFTSTITPTNSLYNLFISCQGNVSQNYISDIDGIFYQRSPNTGVTQPGTITYVYAINSTIYNMTRVKFDLYDVGDGTILAVNDSLTDGSNPSCGPAYCYLSFAYTSYGGDNIKGQYYVAVNGTGNESLINLEGDAYWRFININMNNSVNSFGRFFMNAQEFFNSWGLDAGNNTNCIINIDNLTCNAVPQCKWVPQTTISPLPPYKTMVQGICVLRDNYNKAEFNRIVTIFFFMMVFLFILGRTTGYELNHPGSFVLGMSLVIFILSMYGMFTFAGLTRYDFFNQWIFFITTGCLGGGYAISIFRRYAQ